MCAGYVQETRGRVCQREGEGRGEEEVGEAEGGSAWQVERGAAVSGGAQASWGYLGGGISVADEAPPRPRPPRA